MTSHITVSLWNYCNNNCSYCVSNSNLKEWNLNSKCRIYYPRRDDEGKSSHELIMQYGPGYYDHMCPDKKRYLKASDVLQLQPLRDWLTKNKPNSFVYLSGGEPLLRPDIYDFAMELLEDGHKVIIMTNGMLIHKNRDLLNLPVHWIVTHHYQQNSFEEWRESVEGLQYTKHIVTRIRNDASLSTDEYDEFNFFWRTLNGGFGPALFGKLERIASEYMHLICPDGSVWPCNTQKWGVIGYIYTGEYRPDRIHEVEKEIGRCLENCGAYQTAQLVEMLWR